MFGKFISAGVLACLAFPVVAEPVLASPALRALVAGVQNNSPAIKAAQAAVEAARVRTEASAQPLYNPSLTLEAGSGAATTATVGLSQTLDWNDKRGAEQSIATAVLAAAEAEQAVVQRQLTGELLEALIRLQTAREQRALALRRVQLMQQFAETAERRRTAGDITQMEATVARLAQSDAQVQQARTNSTLIEAETVLHTLTGQTVTSWPELPQTLPAPPSSVDVEATLPKLPEVRLRLAQIQAAQARGRLVTRSQRPDPTVSLRGGKDGDSALIGVGVEIPLFVRRTLRAEVEATGHDLAQTEQLLDDARRRARAQMEGTLARYRAADAAWRTWKSSGLPGLVEQFDLLQRLWEAGELSIADYLVQARQAVDAQVQTVELVGDARQAAMAWLQASGQVESWLDLTNTFPAEMTSSGAQK